MKIVRSCFLKGILRDGIICGKNKHILLLRPSLRIRDGSSLFQRVPNDLPQWLRLLPSCEWPHPLTSRAESERRRDADPISDEGKEQTCVKVVSHLSHSANFIKLTLKKCVLRGRGRGGSTPRQTLPPVCTCLQDSRPGLRRAAALTIYFPSSKLWQRPTQRLQARPTRS